MSPRNALLSLVFGIVSASSLGADAPANLYSFVLDDIDGNPRTLSEWEGKVILIVNTASKCGFTPQFEGLETLYSEYSDQGFMVLGFPSNDFLNQDPGTDEEIAAFCTLNYGVKFPMFSKISVKGRSIHPLYNYLTSSDTNPDFSGRITWNFNKFLIGRDGTILARFPSKTGPDDPKLVAALEDAL